MTLVLWHNPRCSKSRQTLALLTEKGCDPAIRLTLSDPPSEAEILKASELLGLSLGDMVRKGEPLFKSLALEGAGKADLLKAMAAHPILIERPILFAGTKAAIGRPPQAVLEIL